MLYHERERKNKENANFIHTVYLLAKLYNMFGEAIFIHSVYINLGFKGVFIARTCYHDD